MGSLKTPWRDWAPNYHISYFPIWQPARVPSTMIARHRKVLHYHSVASPMAYLSIQYLVRRSLEKLA